LRGTVGLLRCGISPILFQAIVLTWNNASSIGCTSQMPTKTREIEEKRWKKWKQKGTLRKME
jgi:hypothetical protein